MFAIHRWPRRHLVVVFLGIALALLGQAGPTPAAASIATGTGTWIWQNPLPQGNSLWGASCADFSHCVLVGDAGTALVTTDGGLSWISGASRTVSNLLGVSCPTAMICFGVGDVGVILRSADSGSTWSTQVSGTTNSLSGISCPNSATCVAGGRSGGIRAPRNGGAAWSAQISPDPSTTLNPVSCAPSTTCVAVGGGINAGAIAVFTTDGGVHWLAGTPAPVNPLSGVSCPSPSICLAVGYQATVLKTTDGGATWAKLNPNVAAWSGFTSISCPSTTTCLALESNGTLATTDGGMNWSTRSALTAWAIACPGMTTCYTDGYYGAMAKTSDGGNSWNSLSSTVITGPLVRVKCPSPDTCFVVVNFGFFHMNGGPYGSAILGTNDRGRTWLRRYETSTGSVSDISCPSVTSCFAAEGDSILSTNDAGGTWTQRVVGGTTFSLEGIDCPTTTVCFAVGGMQDSSAAVLYTTNGGATWTLKPSAGPYNLNRISCASVQICVAVGYAGSIIRTTDGVNWSTGTSPIMWRQLWGVDCPTATACFAVADQIIATTDGGASWSIESPQTNFLWGVDCATPTTCLVAGRGGVILSTANGGANWSSQNSGTTNELMGVDCPWTTVCFVVGEVGTILALPAAPRSEVAQPAVPQSSAVSRPVAPPPVPRVGPPVGSAVTLKGVRPLRPSSPASASKIQVSVRPLGFGWLWEALR